MWRVWGLGAYGPACMNKGDALSKDLLIKECQL